LSQVAIIISAVARRRRCQQVRKCQQQEMAATKKTLLELIGSQELDTLTVKELQWIGQ